jgi:hypothetical protein
MKRLTREQAAIIGAYTGISAGPFGDIQKYADEKLNTVTFTHQFASETFWKMLKEASKEDFISICALEDAE